MSYLRALAAYVLWGVFPIYWKLLSGVDSVEVICHRIVWSLVTLVICIWLMGQWAQVAEALRNPRRLLLVIMAACLISANWLVFIWAVQHGSVVQCSLGYFINPLLNVVLGVLIFRERLSITQWSAVSVAAVGLMIMTFSTGSVSWIALVLATTFAFYAAVKKQTSLPAVAGLGLETAVLMPLALLYLFWLETPQADGRSGETLALLMMGGPITTLPLLLFAAAAKSVPLVIMGLLQYIAPSLQFLLGIWLYQEKISMGQLLGFTCVWCALALLTYEALSSRRRAP